MQKAISDPHHIVFLDDEGLAPWIKLKELPFTHTWKSYGYTEAAQVVPRLAEAIIALTCSVPLRAEHLRQLPQLQMISLALTGTDIVDMNYCAQRGIVVNNVPDYAANTVAEYVLAVIFALLRKIGNYHCLMQKLRRGEITGKNIWFDYRVRDVAGKTLGIIGNGPIARCLTELARALGMQVVLYDKEGEFKGPEFIPLAQLLARCDVLSINIHLTPEIRNLIDARELAQMKPDAIVINTARGGIVNEAALMDAPECGTLGGAALDVVFNEPLQKDDPLLHLVEHDNFILTPHVAWSSEHAMQELLNRALDNISQHVRTQLGTA